MTADQDLPLARHFVGLPDPRIDRTKKHSLSDILYSGCLHLINPLEWPRDGWLILARKPWPTGRTRSPPFL